MKVLAILAIVVVATQAKTLQEQFGHIRDFSQLKPGYTRIPDWEKIMSGEKKIVQTPPTMKFTPRSDVAPEANCGLENGSDKIVGGEFASDHQFPWQVGLVMDGKYFCGGTLVSKDYVLTAGHCVDGVSNFEIIIGATRADWYGGHGTDVETLYATSDDATLHEEYNGNTISNDIGVIRLPKSIDVNTTDEVRTNCLASKKDVGPNGRPNEFVGEQVLISGWGKHNDQESLDTFLRYVEVPVIADQACEAFYGSLNEGVICVATTGGMGSCSGDSGGPMSIRSTPYKQLGIVSFGSSAGCELGYPAGFTEVTQYLDWISEKTGLDVSGDENNRK